MDKTTRCPECAVMGRDFTRPLPFRAVGGSLNGTARSPRRGQVRWVVSVQHTLMEGGK